MKFLKHCLVLSLIVIAFGNAQAQQRKFSISFIPPFPVTIDSSQDPVVYLSVRNIDTSDYHGSFTYSYTVNGVLLGSSDSSGLEFSVLDTMTINAGDSIIDSIIVHPSPPVFMSGPSVVVIWPIRVDGDFIAVIDSAKIGTNITLTGIADNEPELGSMYYSNGRLFFKNAGEVRLKYVRIADPRGAIVFDSAVPDEQYINVPDLPAGVYIAEAILSNNRRLAFKFISSLH